MKKGLVAGVITSALVGYPFPFHMDQYSNFQQQTSITGRISPSDAAEIAWIMNANRDTFKIPIVSGNFSLPVQSGEYKLIVFGKPPYKSVSVGNLVVKQNHALDVGELILQK